MYVVFSTRKGLEKKYGPETRVYSLMLKILGYSTLGFSASEEEEQRVILTIPVPYIVPGLEKIYKQPVHSAGPSLNWKKLQDEAEQRDLRDTRR